MNLDVYRGPYCCEIMHNTLRSRKYPFQYNAETNTYLFNITPKNG